MIDLYLSHRPVPSQGLFVEAWRALEKTSAADGVRAIEVSNFLQDHLDTLLAETTEAYIPLGQGSDLDVAAVTALAKKHAATPAQIVLAWHLGVSNIAIPKTMHVHRMRENLAATEIIISREEMDTITALDSSDRIGADPAKAAFTQM